ncbi:hypothetical protein GCM10020221_23330 [Streptomyces thioluteus]|uniref:DNA 3'-5' helicase n=1 Tax=Streptomyces thioluteus TaxID=66431 RepID=A0ABP6JA40_STRTU
MRAGKTLVGAGAMAEAKATTLILVTNTVSARQWKHELVKRTSLTEEEIGEYSGTRKEIRPVTIATYQVLTTKRKGIYPHLELFDSRDWGLVVYDEVHLLPAPVFKFTADLQARRRPRADRDPRPGGRAGVGRLLPHRAEAVRRALEGDRGAGLHRAGRLRRGPRQPDGLRAARVCDGRDGGEVPLLRDDGHQAQGDRGAGAPAPGVNRRWSSGSTSTSSTSWASTSTPPVIKGETSNAQREKLFEAFRQGEISVLVVSKVANFSIDLPEATVAIQVSGTFGSRQEEAQRLGPRSPPEGGRARGALLLGRGPRHGRPGLRGASPALPGGAGYAYRIMDADAILAGEDV